MMAPGLGPWLLALALAAGPAGPRWIAARKVKPYRELEGATLQPDATDPSAEDAGIDRQATFPWEPGDCSYHLEEPETTTTEGTGAAVGSPCTSSSNNTQGPGASWLPP